jgi:hypothetical protein
MSIISIYQRIKYNVSYAHTPFVLIVTLGNAISMSGETATAFLTQNLIVTFTYVGIL